MPSLRTITTYALIGIIVICIGALAGWYFVLRSKTSTTSLADSARGYGDTTPSAGANGSTYQNTNSTFSDSRSGNGATGGAGQVGSNAQSAKGSDSAGINDDQENGAGATATGNASTNGSTTATSLTGTAGIPVPRPKTPRLWHVSKTPVAGSGFGMTDSHILYYAERVGGYIFRTNTFTGEVLRLSNTLKPKSYEALFTRAGAVLLRSIDDKSDTIETFSGKIASSTSSSPGTLVGEKLESNIRDVVGDPDSGSIFYTMSQSGTPTIGISSAWNGTKGKRIFTSPLGSWKPYMLSDGRFIIAQKPEDGVLGYAYDIQKDGSLTSLVRAIPGLTILPLANSPALLYGSSGSTGLQLYLQEIDGTAFTLPLKTTADKCVWVPYPAKVAKGAPAPALTAYCAVPATVMGSFLTSWYRGALHTTDSWWRINGKTGEAKLLYSPSTQGGASIDVIDPQIDPSGNFISFKNNTDASLWVLRITP